METALVYQVFFDHPTPVAFSPAPAPTTLYTKRLKANGSKAEQRFPLRAIWVRFHHTERHRVKIASRPNNGSIHLEWFLFTAWIDFTMRRMSSYRIQALPYTIAHFKFYSGQKLQTTRHRLPVRWRNDMCRSPKIKKQGAFGITHMKLALWGEDYISGASSNWQLTLTIIHYKC